MFFVWVEMDSNHRSDDAADLQSAPFGHSGIYPRAHRSGAKLRKISHPQNIFDKNGPKSGDFLPLSCRFATFVVLINRRTEMSRKILQLGLMAVLLIAVLSGCSKSFKIKGNIVGLSTQNLRVLYATPVGVWEQWVMSQDNRFEVKGQSEEPALVTIYNAQGSLVARFLLENGDEIKVRGTSVDPYKLEVKGPDVDERWYAFIQEHASQYSNDDRTSLNIAIADYAKQHPDDVLSTLLLLCDYRATGGIDEVRPMLEALKPEARPESLLATYHNLLKLTAKPPTTLPSLLLYESKGDFASFSPTTARASVLYLWSKQNTVADDSKPLSEAITSMGDKVLMADVLMDADTSMWYLMRREYHSAWTQHYWAPEGPMNEFLKPLKISATPTFIVADSLGHVTYAGGDVKQAVALLKKLIP